jgi:polysaccharide deacetylase family protein (PEP-CTERM system associated)
MLNALTVDVEDYFQVTAFSKAVSRDAWDSFPLRVVENTRRVLDLFDEFEVKATFFILGWIAEREPGLVREIALRGHEVATHGYGHELVYDIGPERFRADLRRSRAILESITGKPVLGYRAPSYSITVKSMWALDILVEEGFAYDSSIFPVRHDIYGVPGAERFPHVIRRGAGEIVEFPLTTWPLCILGKQCCIPVAGGGYLRLLPAGLIRKVFQGINEREGQPAVLYFHPWEVDPGQPRMRACLKSRFRHYLNLSRTEAKLRTLLSGLSFAPMSEVLEGMYSKGWRTIDIPCAHSISVEAGNPFSKAERKGYHKQI